MVGYGRRCAILVGVGEGRRHGSEVLSRGARVETEGKVRRGEARRDGASQSSCGERGRGRGTRGTGDDDRERERKRKTVDGTG